MRTEPSFRRTVMGGVRPEAAIHSANERWKTTLGAPTSSSPGGQVTVNVWGSQVGQLERPRVRGASHSRAERFA